MVKMDSQKNIYLFTHGRMDLQEKAVSILVSKGFSKLPERSINTSFLRSRRCSVRFAFIEDPLET